MRDILRKNLLLVLAGIIILLLAGFLGCLFCYDKQKIDNLTREKDALDLLYAKAIKGIETANESIKQKDAEITEKNKEIEDLKQAKNETVQSEVASDTKETSNSTESQQSSSIYNNINGSDDFKNKITNALNLLSAGDSEHFQIASSQVASINEYNDYGGYQEKRNIYIGADANAAITASLISHEAQHVYNVYVNRIYSYHTKEQELPCYEAELETAERLNAPAFFITSIQSNITYWQSQ